MTASSIVLPPGQQLQPQKHTVLFPNQCPWTRHICLQCPFRSLLPLNRTQSSNLRGNITSSGGLPDACRWRPILSPGRVTFITLLEILSLDVSGPLHDEPLQDCSLLYSCLHTHTLTQSAGLVLTDGHSSCLGPLHPAAAVPARCPEGA